MARGESWGAWGAWLGVALAPGSCGQTCWQPVGRGKGRSSKRAFSAGGQAAAPRPTPGEAVVAWEGAGARPGAEGLRGAHTALQTDRRKPARAPAGPREPRAPRPFPPTLASVSLPKVQNIYKVCSAPQARVPGASGRSCPASAMGSARPAPAAGLGLQGRAESECARRYRARAETHVPPPLSSG